AADLAHGRRAALRTVHNGSPVRGPARRGRGGRLTAPGRGWRLVRPRSEGRRWRLVRARPDAVPSSVRRFTARARQRRLRAARPWLVALAVLALVGGALAVLYATPLLGVAEVRVVGARLVPPDAVREAAAVRPGTPLARVDLGAVARRVGALPPVARVAVQRSWPDGLVVRVVERVPAAAVPVGGGFAIVDGTGHVFDAAQGRLVD